MTLVFDTEAEDDANVSNPLQYRPQQACCKDAAGNIYVVYRNRQTNDEIWLVKLNSAGVVQATEQVYTTDWSKNPSCCYNPDDDKVYIGFVAYVPTASTPIRYNFCFKTRDCSDGSYSSLVLVTDMGDSCSNTMLHYNGSTVKLYFTGKRVASTTTSYNVGVTDLTESANWPFSDNDANLTKLTNVGSTTITLCHACSTSSNDYCIIRAVSFGNYQISLLNNEGGAWSSSPMTGSSGTTQDSAFCLVDSDDRVHCYCDQASRYIMERSWHSGGWDAALAIMKDCGVGNLQSCAGYSDSDSQFHIFYASTVGLSKKILEIVSSDKGSSWSTAEQLTNTSDNDTDVSVAYEDTICAYYRPEAGGDYAVRILGTSQDEGGILTASKVIMVL